MAQQSASLNTDQQGKRTTSYYGNTGAGSDAWYHWSRVADGGHATIGTTSDVAATGGSATLISIQRRVRDVAQSVYNSTVLANRSIPVQVKTLSSVAATAMTGPGAQADVDVSAHKDVLVVLNVTAVSGTCVVTWQTKHSANTYATHTQTSITATGVYLIKVNAPIGNTGRLFIQPTTSVTVATDVIKE